jgi:spermidine synthase
MDTPAGETLIYSAEEGPLQIAVREAEGLRWLDFGDGGVQSAIDPGDAGRLVLPLNQAMLAGLMLVPTPQRVLLLGTGGGAIARFFAQREPACHGDAIEHSAAVAEIARQFFDFPTENTGWSLHLGEAREFIAETSQRYDLLIVDIAENQHTPQWLSDADFLGHCRERLTATGVLVLNLIPLDAEDFARSLAPVRLAFPGTTACLSVPGQHNILLLAFREPVTDTHPEARLSALSQHWGLPFAEFLQRMRRENPPGSGVF